jgi:hypothetical protein
MIILRFTRRILPAMLLLFLLQPAIVKAQTDEDAIMMTKKNFCIGPTFSYSSWKDYWEGTFKRNNQNLGTVSTKMYALMGTYGITSKLNVVVSAPYIQTHATAGTLHGQKGIQDLSVWLKWMPVEKDLGKGTLSVYTVGGFSLPLTNYEPNFLPMSIGLHSKTLSGRLIADYQLNKFFVTGSGTYTWRSNITIDQSSYYTTQEIISDQVYMPNVESFQLRTGYRNTYLIAEAILSNMTTLGGFDIRKNDMPFPSNKMNWTNVGVNVKWTLKKIPGFSLIGNGSYVLTGRNVGQSTTIGGGIFYVLDFSHSSKPSTSAGKTN